MKFIRFIFFLCFGVCHAQTSIWLEDFSGLGNGTINDGGATAWSTTCVGCATGPPDYEVDGNRFKTYDIDAEGVFTTEAIDISGYTNVSISIDAEETGPLDMVDYIIFSYILDGGAETAFATNGTNINDFNTLTASQTGLNGNSLTIVIRSITNQNNERIYFDNIHVQGVVALPVELLNFEALVEEHHIELHWMTATEENNSHFEIEKSRNGEDWDSVGNVIGTGNSQEIIQYNYIDNSPYDGGNYYRLKQVDFDGSVSYSPIEWVSFEHYQEHDYVIYPNPTHSEVTLAFDTQIERDFEFQLINPNGQIVMDELFHQFSRKTFDLSSYPKGAYIIKLIIDSEVYFERLMLH